MRALALLSLAGCNLFSKDPDATGSDGSDGPEPSANCENEGWFETGVYAPVVELETLSQTQVEVPGVGPMKLLSFVPENPVAVLWVFHGTGGDIGNLTQIEYVRIYNALLHDGFAIVATESEERGSQAQWSHEIGVDNSDFQRLILLRDHLIDTTPLEDATPTFAMGFSNGSNFAGTFMDAGFEMGWDMRAASLHSASPEPTVQAPTILLDAENDETIGETVMPNAYDDQLATGFATDLFTHVEHALDPAEMQKIETLDAEESQLAFDEGVRLGVIDETGARAFDLPDLDDVLDVYENQATVQWKAVIVSQLRVVFATHRVNGERYREIRNRFVCEALGWGI